MKNSPKIFWRSAVPLAFALVSCFVTGGSAFAAKQVTLAIEGMDCASCAKKIEKEVKALKSKGVDTCKVNLKAQTARVTLNDHATANSDDLRAAVKKAGFTATRVDGI